MRDVLDRIEADFDFPTPTRRGTLRKPNALARVLRLVRSATHHPNRIAAVLLIGIVVAICTNALVLQRSRHRAPLFHAVVAVPSSHAPPERRPAAQPRATNVRPDLIKQFLLSPPASQRLAAESGASEAKANHDPIAQLLKVDAEPSKTVLAAQRALVKLGFVLKPDGILGTATRQAIEQFERDHGLAARGTLTPKVLRELAAQSGVVIE